jgi:hypothetical protein
MLPIKVDVAFPGLDALRGAFAEFGDQVDTALTSLSEKALKILKEGTPVGEKSQVHLADTFDLVMQRDANGWIRAVDFISTTDTPDLIWYLEFGTRPHPIFPVNGKFLAFELGGKTIFTRQVMHPGTRAYGFIDATSAYLESEIRELQAGILEGILEGVK